MGTAEMYWPVWGREEEEERRTAPASPYPDGTDGQRETEKQAQPTESDIAELTKLLEEIEEFRQLAERSKPLEWTVQSEQLEESGQTEELKQPEDLVQSKQTEDLEQTKQTEGLEQTKQSKQTELVQTKQSEQSEALVQSKETELVWTEQSEQTEDLVHAELVWTEQPKQTEDLVQTELVWTEQPKQTEDLVQTEQSKQTEDLVQTKQSTQTELVQTNQSEDLVQTEQMKHTDLVQSIQTEDLVQTELVWTEQPKQTDLVQTEQSKQTDLVQSKQAELVQTEDLEHIKQSGDLVQTEQPKQAEDLVQTQLVRKEQPKQTDLVQSKQAERNGERDRSALQHVEGPGNQRQTTQTEQLGKMEEQTCPTEPADAPVPRVKANGVGVDREGARRLAERLYRLQDVRRTDVVGHMDKDNEFSRMVGEEYLRFFDFTGQTLDRALRSFLKVVVLIGETQERERVLQRFASRFQECNPESFSSSGAVITLTCALMLLNTDLHGQNVGKPMSSSAFVANLDGMNEGGAFHREMLKGLYSSIKREPLEWAVDEEELKFSTLLPGDARADAPARSKSNPFQDVPHDAGAAVFKQGFLTRKAHADIDGKRTPWGKRSWKTFYAVLKGLVLYLQKDESSSDWQSAEEVISVHHSLAEPAVGYTRRPHVFRLQTADWRVYLLQAASVEQVTSWMWRINLASALYSSPPFPAAVGSQKRFSRPILPAKASPLTLESKQQSHSRMLESFCVDLDLLQHNPPDPRRAKTRDLEEHRVREEYLQHERTRYALYLQTLEVWRALGGEVGGPAGVDELELFDRELRSDLPEEPEQAGLKKAYSSPSLDQDMAPPTEVKVKRNVSERQVYHKPIIPRRNRDL
ncbi:hypothetical protein AAFF_G00253320 [Aldrovandia affinis]|uniref:PH and SEC7 domain-containing protein 4-like n=1 Tax=Aldrovandia affinis TaxID=143900 RepID=A0AAD7SV23_9TELE|nr:hypothetical protein AAFF_G00253320 [Aldrovandia affinis]